MTQTQKSSNFSFVARFAIFTRKSLYINENFESHPTHAFDTDPELQINSGKLDQKLHQKSKFSTKPCDISKILLNETKGTQTQYLTNLLA